MFRIFACLTTFLVVLTTADGIKTLEESESLECETLSQQNCSRTDQQAEQLLLESNSSKSIYDEQLSVMKQILNGIEILVENSNKSLDLQIESMESMDSCESAKTSGVYSLLVDSSPVPYEAFCEMASFGGGWTVVQQRLDGSLNFNRSWAEYRDGFGTVGNATEFWLGLEVIHQLIGKGDPHELVIELKNEQGKYGFARYKNFKLADENKGYYISAKQLPYKGTIGNMLEKNLFVKFSTYDRNFDSYCGAKCAGGFWFPYHIHVNLNGPFVKNVETNQGIFWDDWTNAATYSRMMIRGKE